MIERQEQQEELTRLAEEERCNPQKYGWENRYPEIVHFDGEVYDAHGGITDRGTCIYRMMSESRLERPGSSYIEVDKEGYIVKQWD